VNEQASRQRMILCVGLQSGGTTLVSYCFLQRKDTNGVLDMKRDLIYTDFERVEEPVLWIKMTVSSFCWRDVHAVYQDFGWKPEPIMIVRDVRAAYASLRTKPYGFNGTTAEDPPLRTRFRRFLEDWHLFRDNRWPILKFEDLLATPESALMQVCADLALCWDDDMILWPKPLEAIAYVGTPNQTFAKSICAGSLVGAIQPQVPESLAAGLPVVELEWLDRTFAEYNRVHGYPLCVPCASSVQDDVLVVPRFAGSRRQRIAAEIERIQWIRQTISH